MFIRTQRPPRMLCVRYAPSGYRWGETAIVHNQLKNEQSRSHP